MIIKLKNQRIICSIDYSTFSISKCSKINYLSKFYINFFELNKYNIYSSMNNDKIKK
jgi:hypothetical protein